MKYRIDHIMRKKVIWVYYHDWQKMEGVATKWPCEGCVLREDCTCSCIQEGISVFGCAGGVFLDPKDCVEIFLKDKEGGPAEE